MYRNWTQNESCWFELSSFMACNILSEYGFHFALFRMWWTLVLQTLILWEHCLTYFLQKPETLSKHFHHQLTCKIFRTFFLHIIHPSIKLITQPWNCLTCWWLSLTFVLPTSVLPHSHSQFSSSTLEFMYIAQT